MFHSRRFMVLCWLSFASIARSSFMDDRPNKVTRLMRSMQISAPKQAVVENTCLWTSNAECSSAVVATREEATKDKCIEACRSNENCACVTWEVKTVGGDCTLNGAASSGNVVHAADYFDTDALALKDCPEAAPTIEISSSAPVIPPGQSVATVSVTWASDHGLVQVWVKKVSDGPETLFACGASGVQKAAFITAHEFRFSLYRASGCKSDNRTSTSPLAHADTQGVKQADDAMGYTRKEMLCVHGHNLIKYTDKTVQECGSLCDSNAGCLAFEYGRAYGGKSTAYKPGDCNLQDSADTTRACNGSHYNLDLYVPLPQELAKDPAVPEDTQTCPQTIVVAGAETLQPVRMGSYTKSGIIPGSTHSSRPIYKHANGVHMYFWAANGNWIMSSTGYNNDNGTLFAQDKDGTANCPTMASGWEVWNGKEWETEDTITVSTA